MFGIARRPSTRSSLSSKDMSEPLRKTAKPLTSSGSDSFGGRAGPLGPPYQLPLRRPPPFKPTRPHAHRYSSAFPLFRASAIILPGFIPSSLLLQLRQLRQQPRLLPLQFRL